MRCLENEDGKPSCIPVLAVMQHFSTVYMLQSSKIQLVISQHTKSSVTVERAQTVFMYETWAVHNAGYDKD